MMTDLALTAGFPENVIQFIAGSGARVGRWLVENPDIAAVSLTGSTRVGIEIMKAAASGLHRVFLELGGNDAFIVHEDADLDLAVREALSTRIQNTGQTCCAPKRFIVHDSIKKQFSDLLIDSLKLVRMDNPLKEETELGCLISSSARETVMEQVGQTVNSGAVLRWGGEPAEGAFYQPAVLTGVDRNMDVARNLEIFGPVFPIIGFSTDTEAVEIANASEYGLSGGVFSRDTGRALRTASAMECGCTVINGSGTYRTLDMPFGGYKKSGIGREGILNTIEEMSQLKTMVLKNIL